MKRTLPLMLVLLVACAEDVPGAAPDPLQLHFPTGMVVTTDRLIVANSNFDQRFNAGSVVAIDLEALFNMADDASPTAPTDMLPIVDRVRIHDFAGDLLYITNAAGEPRLFVPSRGRNRLTMLRLEAGGFACDTAGAEPVSPAFDCTAGHIIDTGADDPFSLTHLPGLSTEGLLAVGHLGPTISGNVLQGVITLVDLATFERRREQEANGQELSSPIVAVPVSSVPGISGLATAPASANGGLSPTLIAVGRDDSESGSLSLTAFDVVNPTGRFSLTERERVRFDSELGSTSLRSLAVSAAGDRAFVSLRYAASGSSFNAGIGVVAIDDSGLELVSVLEFGEELGRPTLLEQPGAANSRLLYVPDIRTDTVWVVDASTDVLRVVGQISGRAERPDGDKVVRMQLLDAPTTIVFAERAGRRLGFVTNFGNSTLAMFDATDPDPRRHQIMLRLGRVLEPDGTGEDD